MNRDLPTLIRELRTEAKLSVPDLAALFGRGEAVVYAWEATDGFRRCPSPAELNRLLDMAKATNKTRAEALVALAVASPARRPRGRVAA